MMEPKLYNTARVVKRMEIVSHYQSRCGNVYIRKEVTRRLPIRAKM